MGKDTSINQQLDTLGHNPVSIGPHSPMGQKMKKQSEHKSPSLHMNEEGWEKCNNLNTIKVSDLRQPKEVNFENVNEELNDVFENQEEKALSGPSPDFNIDVNFG